VFIGIFTIPMFPFLFLFQGEGFLGFSPFIENNTSVSIKRYVVFNKTTRHFQQNNTWVERKRHALSGNTSSDNAQQAEGNRKNSKKQKYP